MYVFKYFCYRFDLRPFLYRSSWPWQFRSIDRALANVNKSLITSHIDRSINAGNNRGGTVNSLLVKACLDKQQWHLNLKLVSELLTDQFAHCFIVFIDNFRPVFNTRHKCYRCVLQQHKYCYECTVVHVFVVKGFK